jgi:hypothetical protein
LLQQLIDRRDSGRGINQRAKHIEREFWQRNYLTLAHDFGFTDVYLEVIDSKSRGWSSNIHCIVSAYCAEKAVCAPSAFFHAWALFAYASRIGSQRAIWRGPLALMRTPCASYD